MARPLIFNCPNSNVVVLTRIQSAGLPTRQPMLISCPCGATHTLHVSEALQRGAASFETKKYLLALTSQDLRQSS
jgi:hypothetical protein